MKVVEKIVKEVTKGTDWRKVKRDWIDNSFRKYGVTYQDYEETMEKVYDELLNLGYDVV